MYESVFILVFFKSFFSFKKNTKSSFYYYFSNDFDMFICKKIIYIYIYINIFLNKKLF